MAHSAVPSQPKSPLKSPSYPQRVHIRERAQWEQLLKGWDQKIAAAGHSLNAKSDKSSASKLYAQMLGARDQIADAVARLPMEVGEMYHEDHHRLEEAVAALERLFARWQ